VGLEVSVGGVLKIKMLFWLLEARLEAGGWWRYHSLVDMYLYAEEKKGTL